MPAFGYIIIAGDLIGHVGRKVNVNWCLRGEGFGIRKEGGENISTTVETT